MNAADASRTAMATSLMRAVHARHDPAPVLHDTWGEQLVPTAARAAFIERGMERVPSAMREWAMANPDALMHRVLRSSAAYADVILRARYAEDALQAAVARGVAQYVIVGAGFDSFALRRPANAAPLAIYEVDHPATQSLKRQRLTESGVADADAPYFIATDLSAEGLGAALARSSYQPALPSFFSWLGVTMYLTRDANLATLRAIATHAPPGSELVFNYVDQAAFDPSFTAPQSFQDLRNQVASAGESFQSGFDPLTLADDLRAIGLELLEDLDGDRLLAKYDSAGSNGLQSAAAAHIAHARVAVKGENTI